MTGAPDELRAFWTGGRRIERTAYLIGAVLLVVGLGHLVVQAVLGGPWNGPVSWRKPTTFGISFGVTLISLTWVTSFLRFSDRLRGWLLGAWATASLVEVALITAQAWRRVPSHFNLGTTFDALVARSLAAGAAVLTTVLITVFVLSLRPQPHLSALLVRAIRLGFAALLLAFAVGAVMIAAGLVLVFSGDQQAAYAEGGSFKLAHFAAMHGIAILPAMAWLARRADWTQRRRNQISTIGSAGYLLAAAMPVVAIATGPAVPLLSLVAWAMAIAGASALLVTGGLVTTAGTGRRTGPQVAHSRQ